METAVQILAKNNIHFFNKALSWCFFCAIALMPFNGIHAIPKIFGEFSIEGAFYPIAFGMTLGGLILLLNPRLPKLQHISFKLFLLFLIWVFISAILNYSAILNVYTKGKTGLEKLVLQSILLAFAFLTTLLGYYVFTQVGKDRMLKIVKNAILVSFIIAGAYSLIEIPYLFGASRAEKILVSTNSLFRDKAVLFLYPGRLRSVCAEASLFGSYFSFAYPWLLGCLFYTKKNFPLYLSIVTYALVMVYLTFSRTAYFITAVETLLFIVLMAKRNRNRKEKMRLFVFMLVLACLGIVEHFSPLEEKASEVVKSFLVKDTKHKLSNIGRFGSGVAGLKMGCDNPIAGVGLGQYVFHMPEYVPSWAWESRQIREWANRSPGTAYAHTFNVYIRIFAELGVVGLMLWLFIWGTALISVCKIAKELRYYNPEEEIFGIVLIVSILGVMLSGFNMDSFRFMRYWFLLPIVWVWVKMNTMQMPSNNNLAKECSK